MKGSSAVVFGSETLARSVGERVHRMHQHVTGATYRANDPANLLAVQGQANQDKGDKEPATWMPPNTAFRCQYAMQFIAVLRGYALPIDTPSAVALRDAAATCPTG